MSSIKRRKAKAGRKRRRLLIVILAMAVTSTFELVLFFGVFTFVARATFELPNLKDQKLFSKAQTTKVYDANGELITDLYVEQNRVLVPLAKISPYLQKAVVAIEDKRFFKHEGVDWRAIARALLVDVRQGKIVEGGSTLTQQYVKNTLISPERTFERKVREAALAFQVERKFTKKEILEGYLNTIYFGQSAYGAETAAQTFFGKSSQDLELAEAALMAGVIRSPNNYSPYVNLEGAKRRRNRVLKNMLKQKTISSEEASLAMEAPIELEPLKSQDYPFPYFVEFVKQQMLEDPKLGSTVSERANTLFKGGLRIYTTIDPKKQRHAYDAVWSTLNREGDPVGSLVSIEPKTGYIKAMVGGKDWKTQKLNLASQGFRQPGSSFKPFVLAAALADGMSISQTYQSGPAVIKLPGKNWVVNNSSGGGGRGLTTLHDATVFSINAVFARLIMDVGADKVAELSRKMGVESPVEALPAIALGGLGHGVSALDMATAYSTFANNGAHAKPIAITKVTDASGNIIKENLTESEPTLDPAVAYLVTDTLKDVMRYGTGRRASIGRPAAGKTGTAEHYGDAWFVGYTPELSTAVWVGYRDSNRWMTNVHGIAVQGGSFPADIWRKYMSGALSGTRPTDFEKPTKGLMGIRICTDMAGYAANQFCPDPKWATFAKNAGPKRICFTHTAPPNIAVPAVIGKTLDEAKISLSSSSLTANVIEIDRGGIPANQVVSQSPGEGTDVPSGSVVDIEVSTGRSATIRAPGVIGLPKTQAIAYLKDAGLAVETHKVNVEPKDRIGMVVSQKPGSGKTIKIGATIQIWIGR